MGADLPGGSSMRNKDIELIKKELQKELHALKAKADIAVGELMDADTIQEPDPLDRAMEEQARDRRIRFQGREYRLIAKIERSLQTIDDGTYGICESCEEPIAIARLKARPVTSYCIDCKTKQENHEQLTGS
jgi:DnaK suppressor protein